MHKAKILIIEDNEDLAFTLANVLRKEGYAVSVKPDGESGLKWLAGELIDLVLLDLKLPHMDGLEVLSYLKENYEDLPVIMMTASSDAKPAIEALKKGAYDYLMKPFELDELKTVVHHALEHTELKRELLRFKRQTELSHPANQLLGTSPAMEEVRRLIRIVAETPKTSVLIQGESGTGKELVAHAIHEASARKEKPFVTINCSAIPEHLLESELFGHEKGAFTDAKVQKKGLFELADGGTLFLDEIPSMKLSLQPKLLRVIETQTFRRIGGLNDIQIDVRILAASNTDLAEMVKAKEFRDDLYYRLKVMEIRLPPLRERENDVLLLARVFLEQMKKEFNRHIEGFTPETERLLLSYPWPGNVRELKNVVERAVILCEGPWIMPEHLPIELRRAEGEGRSSAAPLEIGTGLLPLEEVEKRHILSVLRSVGGNKSQAAKVLAISRSTLREKLKAYGLET